VAAVEFWHAAGLRPVWLWLLYGSTLRELGDLDAAETAVRRID
jgi:hypothetical protein